MPDAEGAAEFSLCVITADLELASSSRLTPAAVIVQLASLASHALSLACLQVGSALSSALQYQIEVSTATSNPRPSVRDALTVIQYALPVALPW